MLTGCSSTQNEESCLMEKIRGGDRVCFGSLLMETGLEGFCQGGFLKMLRCPWRMSMGKEV
jgi:hypothetical protein